MPECVYCGGKFDAIAMGGSNKGTHDWLACCRSKADLVPELLAALKSVVGVADRKTVEFDAARRYSEGGSEIGPRRPHD